MSRPMAGERPAALEEFMSALRQLREQAGNPSFRRMATTSGAVSHATLHLTVTGRRLQPWETVREFVRACGGDEQEWHTRWKATHAALTDESSRAARGGAGAPVERAEQGADGSHGAGEVPGDRDGLPDRSGERRLPGHALQDLRQGQAGADRPTGQPGVGGRVGQAGESPKPAAEPARKRPPVSRHRWLLVLLVLVVAAAAATVTALVDRDDPPHVPKPVRAVHPGDASDFIADVTIPDGTVVPPDSQFVKVWELKNSGSVHWRDRYLQRIDLPIRRDDCRTPERIPINDTAPQEHVQITVTVRTPDVAPVDCTVYWKMVDEAGQALLPGYRPIFFAVHVRR